MSKVIKQMQMNALKKDFDGVRDMVLLNIVGLDAIAENQIRLGLRKKGIRLQLVKNSLARRVFKEMGLNVLTDKDAHAEKKRWTGSTTVAWGGNSVAELSKELETIVKKHEKKMKVKTAVADGQEVSFAVALKMPTKAEILSTIVGMIIGPASQIAGQVMGPAMQVAGQVKTLSERKEEAPAAPPA